MHMCGVYSWSPLTQRTQWLANHADASRSHINGNAFYGCSDILSTHTNTHRCTHAHVCPLRRRCVAWDTTRSRIEYTYILYRYVALPLDRGVIISTLTSPTKNINTYSARAQHSVRVWRRRRRRAPTLLPSLDAQGIYVYVYTRHIQKHAREQRDMLAHAARQSEHEYTTHLCYVYFIICYK